MRLFYDARWRAERSGPEFGIRLPLLVALVGAIGCSDNAAASAVRPTVHPDLTGGAGAGASLGVGGSYALSAGGEKIIALPLSGTGIRVPAGAPVRVRVTGSITRTQTAGLQQFCALPQWQQNCQTIWAEIAAEAPIPPS